MQINQCRQEDSTTWLCENNWAWKNADDHSCERSPSKPSKAHSCEMMEFQVNSFIKEISGSNRWLFRLFRNTTANIRRNEQHLVIRLPNQGIIQLLVGCTAILGDTTIITPQKVISTASEMSIFPSLRIIDEKWNVVPLKHLIVNNTAKSSNAHQDSEK